MTELRPTPAARTPGRAVPILIILVSLVGLAASVYLLDVFFQVRLGEASGDHLCSISETVNCEKVAESKYSVFAGIPLAGWGVGLYLALMLAAGMRLFRRQGAFSWDAVLFWLPLVVFVDDVYLAWLQFSCIHSICIVCFLTYALNLLVVLAQLSERRWALGALAREAWADVRWLFGSGARAALSGAGLLALGGTVAWFSLHPMGEVQLPAVAAEASGNGREPVRGPQDAPVKVMGITDFLCPYCARAAVAVEEVLARHPDAVRFEHLDYPLDNECNPNVPKAFHKNACLASYASRCAGRQGRYWPYHQLLFQNQHELGRDSLLELARRLGLDTGAFQECLADPDGSLKAAVQADIQRAVGYGLRGTPTFIVNGAKLEGFIPAEKWEEILSQAGAK
jgi:protein-disulfide isomerase/uncharacterized membrane protein